MTTAKTPDRSLHRKLAQVMYEAERIPKRGKAPAAMGGFPFVQVGDAADFIRKALAEKVISMVPTKVTITGQTEHQTKAGGSMTTVDMIVDWTLTDGESGEAITIQSFGAGADGGDKYSGKAQTNAMKYALLMGFLLSTGDDPELSDSSDRRPRQRAVGDYDEPPDRPELERTTHTDGLLGVANLGKNGGASSGTDFQLRQEKDGGHVIGFRLTQGRKGYKVLAFDPLASVLATQNIIGENVTCWGTMHDESFREDKTGKLITYQIMHLERIATPDMILPAPASDTPVNPANPDEVSPLRDDAGANTVGDFDKDGVPWLPLDDDEERAAIAGSLPGA